MFKTVHARLSAVGQSLWIFIFHRSLPVGLACAFYAAPLLSPYGIQAHKPQANGKHRPQAARPKAALETGRALFQKNCSLCHGANGQGGEGPNLHTLTLTDTAIRRTIQQGVRGEMPAFGGKLKEADFKALTMFLHSFKKRATN